MCVVDIYYFATEVEFYSPGHHCVWVQTFQAKNTAYSNSTEHM